MTVCTAGNGRSIQRPLCGAGREGLLDKKWSGIRRFCVVGPDWCSYNGIFQCSTGSAAYPCGVFVTGIKTNLYLC